MCLKSLLIGYLRGLTFLSNITFTACNITFTADTILNISHLQHELSRLQHVISPDKNNSDII